MAVLSIKLRNNERSLDINKWEEVKITIFGLLVQGG
jgi:hypothetical protein